MSDSALVIMARYPEEGKGKTRLARSLGDAFVKELYQAFLTDLAQRFADYRYPIHWAYTPAESDFAGLVHQLTPAHTQEMACFAQQGRDLGERLLNAFQWTSQHGIEHTILIGSDTPQISIEMIEEARAALDQGSDVVLGPAEDGGYYLIAMRAPYDLFSGIPMSTDKVLQQTIEAAEKQGLTTYLLKPLFDIDELPDLQKLATLLVGNKALAPATAAVLARSAPQQNELLKENTVKV